MYTESLTLAKAHYYKNCLTYRISISLIFKKKKLAYLFEFFVGKIEDCLTALSLIVQLVGRL